MNKPNVQYDSEARILSIRLAKNKSVDSDVRGNVVMDYDKDGNLVNVDIMEISLSEFRRSPVVRKMVGAVV